MEVVKTVRVNKPWLAHAIKGEGGMTHLAERIGVDKSTISRAMRGEIEASPRFIAAVLTSYPVPFQDAFDVDEMPTNRTAVRSKATAA